MDIMKTAKDLWAEWEKSVTTGSMVVVPFVSPMGAYVGQSVAIDIVASAVNGETIYNETGYPTIPENTKETPKDDHGAPKIDWSDKPSQYFENVVQDDKVVKALVIKPNHEKLIGEGPYIPPEYADDIAAINKPKAQEKVDLSNVRGVEFNI